VLAFTFMNLADAFIQSGLEEKNKSFVKEPTIVVVHNAMFIRQH